MTQLVIHRRFWRIESEGYINGYVRNHVAPGASDDPWPVIDGYFRSFDWPALWIDYDAEAGWIGEPFDGWD